MCKKKEGERAQEDINLYDPALKQWDFKATHTHTHPETRTDSRLPRKASKERCQDTLPRNLSASEAFVCLLVID